MAQRINASHLVILVVGALGCTSTAAAPAPVISRPTQKAAVAIPQQATPTGAPAPVALPLPATPTGLPRTTKTFGAAKTRLYRLHRVTGRQRTLYCGCAYKGTKVDLSTCGHPDPTRAVNRARKVEAEHMYPAHHFGQHRPCWRDGHPTCTKRGRGYKGRKCCVKVDPLFRAAHNDLHNLWPSVGSVNGARTNYRYGVLPTSKYGQWGWCKIKVNRKLRVFEPPVGTRGILSRSTLYMSWRYGFKLSDQQRQLFTAWDRMYPPQGWEIQRNKAILVLQGSGNPFITRAPQIR